MQHYHFAGFQMSLEILLQLGIEPMTFLLWGRSLLQWVVEVFVGVNSSSSLMAFSCI